MNSLIIAAGKGKRIKEFTKKIPKSLIKINNKTILKRQIDFMKKNKIKKISIVKGFRANKIKYKSIKYFYNLKYKKNEQLDSFFCAKEFFNEDTIVSFSDIIYDEEILKKIIKTKNAFTIAIQRDWKQKYKKRFDHPMSEADKVIVKKNKITQIGKKISINKTNGEFLGIFKISKNMCKTLIKEYEELRKYKNTSKFQIHHFFQYLINKNIIIKPTYVFGKYMEIDTLNDFNIAKKIFHEI